MNLFDHNFSSIKECIFATMFWKILILLRFLLHIESVFLCDSSVDSSLVFFIAKFEGG